MAFSRTRALRSLQFSLRYSGKRVVPRASARTQLVQRRYASGGGHGEEKSSDIPWAIGAVAVTIPSCYFLWPDQSTGHGEHGGHEEHEEKEEEKEEEAPQEEESKDESQDEGEDSKAESKEADDKAESKEADDKADKDDGGEEQKEGKATEASGNASKSLPPGGDDSQTQKGGGKKEESKDDSGDDEGKDESKDEGSDEGESEEKGESKDEGASNHTHSNPPAPGASQSNSTTEAGQPKKSSDPTKRPKGAKGSMEEKQYGFSNTDTRHPYKDDSGRSRKSDGSIETSKTMGTVDPSRPLK